MQRTRLRRGATSGLSGRRRVANGGSGQPRRAADAIVGQGAEEGSAQKAKRKSGSGEDEWFWGSEGGCQTVASEFGGVAVEERGTLKIGRGLVCG